MLSRELYNVIHVLGLAFLLMALGSMATTLPAGTADRSSRRIRAVLHGLGLFLILLGGFGMLARLGVSHREGWPAWLWIKLGIWFILGGATVIPLRFPAAARSLMFAVPVLAGIAAYMAIYKPVQ
jgi:hypothetical protein